MVPRSATTLIAGDIRLLRFVAGRVEIHYTDDRVPDLVDLDFASVQARPFLKWTGGKQWLAPLAAQLTPNSFKGRYFEPFLGGGAMFFSMRPNRATLSDLNDELIAAYTALRDDPDGVIRELRAYPHDKDFFLMMRRKRPRSAAGVAARMIYLNKTAFNGMYRVNAKGGFNVPFGTYKNPTICHEPRLRAAAHALRGVSLRAVDFETATRPARSGDFVFMDPPYITGHQNNGFRKYNADLFSWDDQERLSRCARSLADRGVFVAVSNASHPAVRELYHGFAVTGIERRSLINSNPNGRTHVPEALYTSYAPIASMSVVGPA